MSYIHSVTVLPLSTSQFNDDLERFRSAFFPKRKKLTPSSIDQKNNFDYFFE